MKNSLKITQEVSLSRISNLLCDALEGGSNYWYMIEEQIKPTKIEFHESIGSHSPKLWAHEYPLNPGGALIISSTEEDDGKKYRLDFKAVERGLKLFSESKEMKHHWADFINENEDGITADVFFQFCVLGEVIYG